LIHLFVFIKEKVHSGFKIQPHFNLRECYYYYPNSVWPSHNFYIKYHNNLYHLEINLKKYMLSRNIPAFLQSVYSNTPTESWFTIKLILECEQEIWTMYKHVFQLVSRLYMQLWYIHHTFCLFVTASVLHHISCLIGLSTTFIKPINYIQNIYKINCT